MAFELNEPVVSAIVARLNTSLAGEISTINATVTDGATLEAPKQVLDFIPPPDWLSDFPTIGVGDGPSTFEDDEGFSATGRHEVLIVVYLQDADQQALARRLRRYLKAVARIVLAGRNLDSGAWGTGLVRIAPGPTLTDDPENPQTWLSWAGVQIWAKRDEE